MLGGDRTASGLTTDEARRRFDTYGPNEPVAARHPTLVTELVQPFGNLLVLILLAASAISVAVGQSVDATIIVSIDVLCSDKIGTLTTGEMRLEASVDPGGHPAESPRALGYVNSHFQTGIRSPFDHSILDGSPIDLDGYVKVDELPFDFERRRVSVVVDTPGGSRLLVTKGAPESIVPLCVEAGACDATIERFGTAGLRLLAVASKEVEHRAGYSRATKPILRSPDFSRSPIPCGTMPLQRSRRFIETASRSRSSPATASVPPGTCARPLIWISSAS